VAGRKTLPNQGLFGTTHSPHNNFYWDKGVSFSMIQLIHRLARALRFTVVIFFLGTSVVVSSQAEPLGQSENTKVMPGIVVEKLTDGYDGAKSGILANDILLGWKRGDQTGEFKSPYALWFLEIEQRPLGTVTIYGLRGDERKTWTMGPDYWGIKSRPNFSETLLSLYNEGQDLARQHKPSEAEQVWLRTARMLDNGESQELYVWLLAHIADAFSAEKQWQDADRTYQQAVDRTQSNSNLLLFPVLRSWGASYTIRNASKNADDCYQKALGALKQRTDHPQLTLSFTLLIALDAWQRGDLERAQELYREAAASERTLAPESLDSSNILTNLAAVTSARGDMDSAEEYFKSALAVVRKIAPDGRSLAAVFVNLGNLMLTRGDLDRAEDYYRQTLPLQEKFGLESPAYAEALGNLALVQWQRGDLANADSALRRVVGILEKALPNSANVARGYINLGGLALVRGDRIEAEEYLLRAVGMEKRLAPGSLELAGALSFLATLATRNGEWEKGEQYSLQALDIEKKLAPNGSGASATYFNLGQIAKGRGDVTKEEQYDMQALAIQRAQFPNSLLLSLTVNDLGNIEKGRGNPAKAEEYFRESLDIHARLSPGGMGHAEALGAVAATIANDRPEMATQLFQQALDAVDKQASRLGGSADTRAAFRARNQSISRNYIDLLLQQGKTEAALEIWERSRARTLLEILAGAHVDLLSGADATLQTREKSIGANLMAKSERRVRLLSGKHTDDQISSIEKEISQLSNEYDEVEEQIRTSNPAYAALVNPAALRASEIQQEILDEGTVLLEYCLGEEHSRLFAVTRNSLQVVELPRRKEIETLARRVHHLLTERNLEVSGETDGVRALRLAKSEHEYETASAELSEMLLLPAAKMIADKRIAIVADGALNYIPFAALPDPGATQENTGARSPLGQRHEIVNLPSASVLALMRKQKQAHPGARGSVAVLADPVFSSSDPRVSQVARTAQPTLAPSPATTNPLTRSAADLGMTRDGAVFLPRLRYSRQEADAIVAVSPRGSGWEATDFAATRAAALSPALGKFRIVHFATHGLVNTEHPELSGLVLSLVDQKGKPQDGFLQLQDIYNMKLSADLVVLSACETGLGKEINGEGLISLTRGFMYAGAPRVVASLWKVSDAATAELMSSFYKSMERDHLAPAAALRAAQLKMSRQKRWQSPYYWAAFELQGDWR
jgi:CHAT domain-containing protein/Tfp pilus assembly protein PilF